MRGKLIRILIKLLRWLSDDRIGIIYHSEQEINRRRKNASAFDVVRNVIVKYYDTSWNRITAPTRKAPIVEKRHMLHTLAYRYTGMSTNEIGQETGKDHATILHSMKVIRNLSETDKRIRTDYNNLCELIEYNLVN